MLVDRCTRIMQAQPSFAEDANEDLRLDAYQDLLSARKTLSDLLNSLKS